MKMKNKKRHHELLA